MGKNPAFQTYASDYYVDTNSWTVDEVGIYQRLLLTEWVNGGLPNDGARLARIAGCGIKKFQKGWTTIKFKFILNDEGLLINKRLEDVRKGQEKYRESQVESGRIGAERRWKDHIKKDSKPITDPITDPNSEKIALQSSSSSSLKDLKNIYVIKFEEFWNLYPKRNGKIIGRKECLGYCKKYTSEEWDKIIQGTTNYAKSKQVAEGYAKDPIRFLKKELWNDWLEPEQADQQTGHAKEKWERIADGEEK